MFIEFFRCIRRHGVAASVTELLDFLQALQAQVVFADVEGFYHLARLTLVKDERFYDRFDRAFAEYFEGVSETELSDAIPAEWLTKTLQRQLSEAEKQALSGYGSLDELLKQFQQRLSEQEKRHAGGSKWIGTGGSSAFGAYGYHPEGIRIGQAGSGSRRAVKVWDKRQFKDLDADQALDNRNLQMALRGLRRFARQGEANELDLAATIQATSRNAGYLDLQWQAERHNAVKVLLLFDVGGSMDDHIYDCQRLFAAAKNEFKHCHFYYFHNCVYEYVWQHNQRRWQQRTRVIDLINTYASDYKLIFVGDATMGPYEVLYPGGSVEHWNDEAGQVWMQRLLQHFNRAVWLNPQPQSRWRYYASLQLINDIMQQHMYPLTVNGIESAIAHLR
ncbi:vWA domain-containing protein [Idiomarina xiamenensis]|uniref:VWA containing CoxE family protein n=1 Tax=Idiomarina xiamenensis 10-D-4 TaxID=740709 RepID=K2KJJ0_9GAMM|nr:VWA domain-containing protein [Idiomarina xiamenensis]EKE86882.1 hypothetical protein A10D4_01532 [Idiomarina xiamenensis 10-D-4]